jgi:hypothetical protein
MTLDQENGRAAWVHRAAVPLPSTASCSMEIALKNVKCHPSVTTANIQDFGHMKQGLIKNETTEAIEAHAKFMANDMVLVAITDRAGQR